MKKESTLLLIFILCSVWCQAQHLKNDFSKLKIAVSSGYAFRLGKKAGTQQYFNDIRQGSVFMSEAVYFLNEQMGIGVDYSLFGTAASMGYPSITSNIKISYIGASYNARQTTRNQKMELSTGIGLGYMGYKDNGWIDHIKSSMTGASLGALVKIGGSAKIVKGLAAGINVNLYGGSLSSMTLNGTTISLEKEQKESLGRIEGVAGLRYNF